MHLWNCEIYLKYINQLSYFGKVKGNVNVYLKDCFAGINDGIKKENNVSEFYNVGVIIL